MKNFFEKVKDFLYDSLDYIIILAIIIIVVLVIGWRVDLLFPKNSSNIVDDQIVNETNDEGKAVDSNIKNDKVEESTIVDISIPEGSSSYAIGNLLEEEGLVSSTDDFVNKARELSLDTKLKSGNFEISRNSSLEDIINLITK